MKSKLDDLQDRLKSLHRSLYEDVDNWNPPLEPVIDGLIEVVNALVQWCKERKDGAN